MPDPTSRILLSSVFCLFFCFHRLTVVQNRPGFDLDGLVRVWPNYISSESKRVCRNHLARFLAGRNRPGSDLVPADCARFRPNGSGPEASHCA